MLYHTHGMGRFLAYSGNEGYGTPVDIHDDKNLL